MTAFFGIVGEHSDLDLESMAERLKHRGDHSYIWSPATDVSFGEVRHWPRDEHENRNIAASAKLALDWTKVDPANCADARTRDQYRRNILTGHVTKDPLRAPAYLDGMFAYAYWSAPEKSLILAVDRLGYARLFFTRTSKYVAFATEYKALLALADVQITPNRDAFQYSISTQLVDLDTALATNIQKVAQFHTCVIKNTLEHTRAYWSPTIRPVRRSKKASSAELRTILLNWVRQTAEPYERIALTLSGGLDSAGLLGIVRNVFPDRSISTYTIGHSSEDPEIVGARVAAEYFRTDHHEYIFDPRSIITDLPDLVWLTEEFAAGEEAVLQYQIERSMLDSEDVIMAGHGADMVFAGMPRHRLLMMAEQIPFAKVPLLELYQQTQSGTLPRSLRGKLASWMLYRGKNIIPPRVLGTQNAAKAYEPKSIDDYLEHSIVEMETLHYHSAAHALGSIDALLPYLSNAIMDFALTVPARHKVTSFKQKIVLRDALAPLLPDSIRKRGKAIQKLKRDRLLSDVLDQLADDLLSESSLKSRQLVDAQYVEQLRRRRKSSVYADDRLSRLWALIVSEIWCRAFLDNRGKPFPGKFG